VLLFSISVATVPRTTDPTPSRHDKLVWSDNQYRASLMPCT